MSSNKDKRVPVLWYGKPGRCPKGHHTVGVLDPNRPVQSTLQRVHAACSQYSYPPPVVLSRGAYAPRLLAATLAPAVEALSGIYNEPDEVILDDAAAWGFCGTPLKAYDKVVKAYVTVGFVSIK